MVDLCQHPHTAVLSEDYKKNISSFSSSDKFDIFESYKISYGKEDSNKHEENMSEGSQDSHSSHLPDVILLQETKATNKDFPSQELEDLGYHLAIHGEKSYNGVAILSKYPMEDINYSIPNKTLTSDDIQARYIEAIINVRGHKIKVGLNICAEWK